MRIVGLHHAAHARVGHRHFGLVFLLVADDALCGEEHACYRGSVFEGYASNLGRVYHTRSAEVAKLFSLSVVAIIAFAFAHLINDDRTFNTSVAADLAQRFFTGATDDVDTCCFVGIVALHVFKRFLCTDVGYATTRYDAFFHCSTCSAESVVTTIFLFFLFRFTCSTHFEHAYTA